MGLSRAKIARRHYDRHIRPMRAAAREAKAEAWATSCSARDMDWIAGIFEGEGTISICAGGRGYAFKPIASVASTDFEIIEMFQQRWPGNLCARHTPKNTNAKPVATWRITGSVRVRYFLRVLIPHLRTTRVKNRAAVVLEFCEHMCAEAYNRESDKSWKVPLVAKIRELNRRGAEDGLCQ